MARVDEYTGVQNALIDKGKNGTFYGVTIDDNHKITRAGAITPKTVLADEISATFKQAHTSRRLVDDYDSWVWQLWLAFDEKAILHEFHYTMTENFVLIPSNTTTGIRQATARLAAAPQIIHPTLKQSSKGTSVVYTLNVRLRPL